MFVPFFFYMPPWWPVLRAEQFQFQCWLISNGFCSNWFQLIFQTANPSTTKKKDFWIEFFFFLRCDNFYCAEGHTEETSSVKHSWKLVNLKILMRIACLGLSNIEELYRSCNFGFYWWIILNIRHTCCTHKSLHKYFRFSP